jgi:selenocysteine-specific elongation factor
MTTDRFDASIEVRTTAKGGLRHHQRVRVHLGTAERPGRLILLGPHQQLAPKQSAFCQLALTEPLVAMRGDHFVVRDRRGTPRHPTCEWSRSRPPACS